MTIQWDALPSADFTERSQWQSLGHNRYAALRVHLLFVRTNGKVSRLGPVIEEHDVVPGDTITLRRKHERVVTQVDTMLAAVRAASTSRVIDGLSAKIASEIGAKAPGFSGKIQAETMVHSEVELTNELERTITNTASHSIEETEGREYEVKLDGQAGRRRVQLRRRYWPRQWNVYLHSFDYLELSYARNWLWRRVRQSMKRVDAQLLGWPLVSVTFFEPQPDVVVCYDAIADELENPESFELHPSTGRMPSTSGRKQDGLEVAARIAFPITRAEKQQAAKRKQAVVIGFGGSAPRSGQHRRKGAKKAVRPIRRAKKAAVRKRAVKRKAGRRK